MDTPAGLVGNPNAVPEADRCDPDTFAIAVCPDSSTVGTIALQATLLGNDAKPPPAPGGGYLPLTFDQDGGTRLSLLKTSPEVPATFGI